MSAWIPLEKDFIEADVIRWEEAVFATPVRRSKKPMKIGVRRVTAEVLWGPDEGGWVGLLVRQCDILSETVIGQVVEKYKNGCGIRRARGTILRGKPERLLWTDETARNVVASGMPRQAQETPASLHGNSATKKGPSRRSRKRTRR